jgi:hypothetical protein
VVATAASARRPAFNNGRDIMLQRPIFLYCFARGGSNILFNVFLSAPQLCSAGAETHKIFEGGAIYERQIDKVWKRLLYRLPLRVLTHDRYLDPRNSARRGPLAPRAAAFFSHVVQREMLRARHPMHNLWKGPDIRYSNAEIAAARPVFKSNDGLVFTAEPFLDAFPDAQVVLLTRDGFALCESRIRRGHGTAAEIGRLYRTIVEEMGRLNDAHANVHLFRFEDFIQQPLATARQLLALAGIDVDQLPKLRVQAKSRINEKGEHVNDHADREVLWLEHDDYDRFFVRDINRNQRKLLASADEQAFLAEAGPALARLGYC